MSAEGHCPVNCPSRPENPVNALILWLYIWPPCNCVPCRYIGHGLFVRLGLGISYQGQPGPRSPGGNGLFVSRKKRRERTSRLPITALTRGPLKGNIQDRGLLHPAAYPTIRMEIMLPQ